VRLRIILILNAMDHPTSTTIKRTYGGLRHLKVTLN